MFEKIIEKLNNADSVGIITHINPDGDAFGSSYSLKAVLSDMGKRAEVFAEGSVESAVDNIIRKGNKIDLKLSDCDMLIALDCADIKRLGVFAEDFAAHNNTAAIDHHITHVPYAENTVVEDLSSACEVIYGMYREMGVDLTIDVAHNLYIGIATDTGNFKYSSVTGDTHRVAAELIDKGVDIAEISRQLFDTMTREYLKLQAKALSSLEFFCGGKVAVLYLSDTDFKECGISEADASPVVSLPISIEGVEVGVYIRQRTSEESKVSLRSARYVDVSKIACVFGGGGHVRASGYMIKGGNRDEKLRELISEIEKQLR